MCEAPPTIKFLDVVVDVAKKLNLQLSSISITTSKNTTLTDTEINRTVSEIFNEYGPMYTILDRGVVGSTVEGVVPEFPEFLIKVTPAHPSWKKRVELEIHLLKRYVTHLQNQGSIPWFQLAPHSDKQKYNYRNWYGHILIPQRPEIKFDLVILLQKTYPLSCPRGFISSVVQDYTDHLFIRNVWKQDGKEFIMLCHEQMDTIELAWKPTLGIAHFFIREVWYWWAAQQNSIIRGWERVHGK